MELTEQKDFLQCLADAGCGGELAEECLALAESRQREKLKQLLEAHRDCLLKELHKEQKKIDCLDFFLYRLERAR